MAFIFINKKTNTNKTANLVKLNLNISALSF